MALRVVPVIGGLAIAQANASPYDPLQLARENYGRLTNPEAVIPVQCYTRTDGSSNPCWVCHTDRNGANAMVDWQLQERYTFSDEGRRNHWENLFVDRAVQSGPLDERRVLEYVRQDNYTPLREALRRRDDYRGWRPDLDLRQGFDGDGLARDGSWWRAFRYKPFPGTFWPTNGSTDDVFIRLPLPFRADASGKPSRDIYLANLAILEAALTEHDIPRHYVGSATGIPVRPQSYPAGTEFLHSVRYVDPDRPSMIATRMKELRYSIKDAAPAAAAVERAYVSERFHKDVGVLPMFRGSPDQGLQNDFGWRLLGFIEDREGRLRLQTREETMYCMGCHGTIGVTIDQTFAFPRKLPGRSGWGYQSLVGVQDVPQQGHSDPEILTYMRRVGAADEFRENDEMIDRFFPGGRLDEPSVRRAAPGGDRDLVWLLSPSRDRALRLNAAYMALVREQSFIAGRDTLLRPPRRVHRQVTQLETGLATGVGIFRDGRLLLDWPKTSPLDD